MLPFAFRWYVSVDWLDLLVKIRVLLIFRPGYLQMGGESDQFQFTRSCPGLFQVWAENHHKASAYSSLSLGLFINTMMEHGVSLDYEHLFTQLPCLLQAVCVDVSFNDQKYGFSNLSSFVPPKPLTFWMMIVHLNWRYHWDVASPF